MSDWFGVYSISDSINAGLDLEMPGINKFRGSHQMSWSIHARKMTLKTVKDRARKVLDLVQRAANGAPEVSNMPQISANLIILPFNSSSRKTVSKKHLTRKRTRC